VKTLTLAKDRLDLFAAVTQRFGELHAPVARGGGYAFAPLDRWSDARLDYPRTFVPPKKYFLPPRETLFRFRPGRGFVPGSEDLEKRVVLFGVHACDIEGLNLLDLVMDGQFPDPYYQTRRRNVAIIGIDCTPDEHCFCNSMRSDFVEKGFDLFLHDLGDRFLVTVGTALGDDMVLAGDGLFEPMGSADVAEFKRRSAAKRELFRSSVELRDLPEIIDLEYESAIWRELGERCLSCGACTAVCPTCYCYDSVDRPALGSEESRRLRCWDSCMFSTHAVVAGGENFRGEGSDRIKFRFYHKQKGFVVEHGRPSCVGCGRCDVVCPAHIEFVEVLNRLRGAQHVDS
jgi:sulfhydrogenase subunit beta (sulfur reductase)